MRKRASESRGEVGTRLVGEDNSLEQESLLDVMMSPLQCTSQG